jgi:patatin-like phospholipase/acyl hydrolase
MTNQKRKILSIDGGGIKGVIPAAFLALIEETTGKRIVDHFDLIAGTSTGGIIAIGLGLGLSAKEILNFYEEEGPRIFDQEKLEPPSIWSRFQAFLRRSSRPARQLLVSKYNADALRAALECAFGNRLLGESETRLVIPAFDLHLGGVHVFKTSHHERFEIDWKHPAVDIALATAAAPTYFPSHKMENGLSLLDGGIWANNPVGLAVVEAIGVLDWPRESLYVLSLGCSEETLLIPENGGYASLASKTANLFMRGQTRSAIGTAKLLTKHSNVNPRLYRYNEVVPSGMFALDSTRQIASLKGVGTSMARRAMPDISSVFFENMCENFIPYHESEKQVR